MFKAIYPGTFDPLTHGHLDIIKRAAQIFDNLTVAVAENQSKNPLFTRAEREKLVKDAIKQELPNLADKITIDGFNGLLVDFAAEQHANVLIRGIRAISDFEYEFQMSCMNSKLNQEIQTIFLPASDNAHFISSGFAKKIASLKGDISYLVPNNVKKSLLAKFE